MAWRYILFDALHSLDRGNPLIILGDFSALQHLEGVPQICLVVEKLIENQWVRPVDKLEIYWYITEEGKRIFEEGKSWYYAQRPLSRFLNRTFLRA